MGGRRQQFVDDDCHSRARIGSHPDMPVCHGTNPRGHSGWPGTANNAWIWNVLSDPDNSASPLTTTTGSYGMNGWLYKYQAAMGGFIAPGDVPRFFPSATAIKHPSQTPSLWIHCGRICGPIKAEFRMITGVNGNYTRIITGRTRRRLVVQTKACRAAASRAIAEKVP